MAKTLDLLDIRGIIPDKNHERIRHTSLKNPVPIIYLLSSKFIQKSSIYLAIIAASGAAGRVHKSSKIRQKIKQYSQTYWRNHGVVYDWGIVVESEVKNNEAE